MPSRPRLALLVGAARLPVTAAASYAAGVTHKGAAQATRTVLAQAVDPAGATGRTLGLSRVTIPPTRGSACTVNQGPRSPMSGGAP